MLQASHSSRGNHRLPLKHSQKASKSDWAGERARGGGWCTSRGNYVQIKAQRRNMLYDGVRISLSLHSAHKMLPAPPVSQSIQRHLQPVMQKTRCLDFSLRAQLALTKPSILQRVVFSDCLWHMLSIQSSKYPVLHTWIMLDHKETQIILVLSFTKLSLLTCTEIFCLHCWSRQET